MIKEYKINDILNAVNFISKIERKKDSDIKYEVFTLNNEVKSAKSDVLVLDQMIE